MMEIAMSEKLKPCPFCGGEAEIIEIEGGENAGGSCVSCTVCLASSNVSFEFKENFVSNWNRRAYPPLREALENMVAVVSLEHARNCPARICDCDLADTRDHALRSALAAIAKAQGTDQ